MSSYRWQSLTLFAAAALTVAGSDSGEARVVADNLVQANLRAIDSHGLIRLPVYMRRLVAGKIATPAKITVIRETAGTALVDGGGGWGAVVAKAAMEMAIAKARVVGTSAVTVCNSNHYGYAAYYGDMAVAAGMIGVSMTNASPTVAPFGGRDSVLGTNPICICVPAGEEPPFTYDGATTVVARGKIDVAAKRGTPIPAGWGVDKNGAPTTDPNAVVTLCPLGGYKGYDLAVAVDILSGVLAGGAFGPYVGSLRKPDLPQSVGHFFMAIDVAAFRDAAGFRDDMDQMIRELRAGNAAPGSDGVLIAGDPERSAAALRDKEGIPLPAEIEADLRALGTGLGVPFPEPLRVS